MNGGGDATDAPAQLPDHLGALLDDLPRTLA
jgi:hypothetical protein